MQNEEEAWLHHTIKQFDEIVCSGKYGPLFYKMLSDDAKLILNNMRMLEINNMEIQLVTSN
jgi:hypothetical protein